MIAAASNELWDQILRVAEWRRNRDDPDIKTMAE
jgi:hypothetical protein